MMMHSRTCKFPVTKSVVL